MTSPVVLLTRPSGGNEALGAALREAGVKVRTCPAVKLVPRFTDAEVADIWRRWRVDANNGVVVVTSTETVGVLRSARVEIDLPIAPVGPATAAAAVGAGWPLLDVAAADAASLARALTDHGSIRGRAVWLPQSAHASDDLRGRLEREGATVSVTHLYEPVAQTDELGEALSEGSPDVVAFFSGSAARAFAGVCADWRGHAVCIGGSTALVAAELGLRVAAVAAAPTDDAMARAILEAVASTGKAG